MLLFNPYSLLSCKVNNILIELVHYAIPKYVCQLAIERTTFTLSPADVVELFEPLSMIIIRSETSFPTAFIFMTQDIVRSALFQLSMITAIELGSTYYSSFAVIAKELQKIHIDSYLFKTL